MKQTFTAKKEYAKLTAFLSEELQLLPINSIKKQMRLGEVRVNGEKVLKDTPLFAGDEVRIFLPEQLTPPPVELHILYADENFAVVNKPIHCETETHLARAMQQKFDYAEPIHRLDRNTRGLVIFALNAQAKDELTQLIKLKHVQRFYRAHVYGVPAKPSNTVTLYLKKDASKAKVFVSDTPQTGYKKSVLRYTVMQTEGGDSELDIQLFTGRTHQIRATMAHLGNPVIGDGKYGSEKINRLHGKSVQMLCANKIRFELPASYFGQFLYVNGKEYCIKP
ncbi:MAG: RluA family pseudouridine synthase [Firmicutes bacterium]|nr:RluA family pseudouridine synthase [Bacillota bacterium]